MHSAIRIALVGDISNELQRAHQAIPRALSASMEGGVETVWISTDSVARGESLAEFDGLWCVPGMPYRNPDGAIAAIRFARTTNMPFLGTSAGFQYASSSNTGAATSSASRMPITRRATRSTSDAA